MLRADIDRIRIAVAGAGLIGRTHVALVRESARVSLSAIADPAPAAEALAREAGVPLYRSLEELIATDRPDAVIVATPNALHVTHALACIEAGVPQLREKPIASSVADARKIVAAAAAARAKILVGHHRAHSPVMQRARQIVHGGALGRIVAVQGSAVFLKPDRYFDEGPWRKAEGGGPILINMIHEVHSLRMLCGDIVTVQALASNATRGFPVEDTVSIGLRFADGALASFLLSDTAASARSWEQTSRENPAYPSYADEDCYVVTGTRGSLAIPSMRIKRYGAQDEPSWWTPFREEVVEVGRVDPLARQLEHFGAVVRGEAATLVSARDGLANLVVTEAIAQAARTGVVVRIDAG